MNFARVLGGPSPWCRTREFCTTAERSFPGNHGGIAWVVLQNGLNIRVSFSAFEPRRHDDGMLDVGCEIDDVRIMVLTLDH